MSSQLHIEHAGLLDACLPLITELADARRHFAIQRVGHDQHNVYTDRASLLARHLQAVLSLLDHDEYASCFTLLRTALEHHLLDRVYFLATRYRQRYTIRPPLKVSAEHARLAALRTSTRPDILRWTETKGTFLVTMSGLHESGRVGKPPMLSPYYFAFEEYDPFAGKAQHQAKLLRPFRQLKLQKNAAVEAHRLWKSDFAPTALVRNLLRNRLLTRRQAVQVDTHYAFLSAFTHATKAGYDIAYGLNLPRTRPSYDHYDSELILLYIATLAAMELTILARALRRRPQQRLKGWSDVDRLIEDARLATSHFWFLWGRPQEWDKVQEANLRMGRGGSPWTKPRIDPSTITDNQVHYYPNPLARIVELHRNFHEITTGLTFASPFFRADAARRT